MKKTYLKRLIKKIKYLRYSVSLRNAGLYLKETLRKVKIGRMGIINTYRKRLFN